MLYLWLKALHIIAFVAWMAGLFYLPRLMVYHAGVEPGTPQSETFKVMERRLYKAIMTPAMIATWIFGLSLAVLGGWFTSGTYWLHAKLALVLMLSAYHGACGGFVRRFAADANKRDARFYRIFNELPTLFLIAIVILVVVKPF